jgi:hypothetical protein
MAPTEIAFEIDHCIIIDAWVYVPLYRFYYFSIDVLVTDILRDRDGVFGR